MKPTAQERHGKLLGPGQYNPNFARGIALVDVTRPSSTFKSTTGRLDPAAKISTPGPAKVVQGPDPGEHNVSAKQLQLWPELDKDPDLETSAFSNDVPRFNSKVSIAANTKTEEMFSPSDLDSGKWAQAKTEFPVKSKREDIFQNKEHETHWTKRGAGADKFYDQHPNTSKNVFAKQRSTRNNATNFTLAGQHRRFPASELETRYAKSMRSTDPAKYRPKSTKDMQVQNSRNSYNSQFKSRVDRFDGHGSYLKKERKLVDFWGWNYTLKSETRKGWKSNGGGHFATNCAKSRFAKPYFAT
jgi:hypothetical protein